MRVLAAVLACLGYTGHGHPVHMTSQAPAYRAGLSGRVEAHDPRDALALILLMRGGISGPLSAYHEFRDVHVSGRGRSGLEDMRGGFGESLPVTQKGSASQIARAQNAANTKLQVDIAMDEGANFGLDQAADIGAISGARELPRGSVDQVHKSFARSDTSRHFAQTAYHRVRQWFGAPAQKDSLAYLLQVRGGMSSYHDLRDGHVSGKTRRGKSGLEDVRGGFVESLPVIRRGSAPQIGQAETAVYTARDRVANIGLDPVSDGQVRKSLARSDTVLVQGGSLKTWSFPSSLVERVQVVLTTDGRPLDADVQLWQGPDNTPCKMRVYSENGNTRPFSAVIATPYGGENTVAVRNVGQIEFPLAAHVNAKDFDGPISDFRDTSIIVQGGALRTFNFDTSVESVEVMLRTDGRPLTARIELLQGPNNNKQVIELYTEDGLERPFFAVIDTMGSGNVVRIVNTAPMEFPMTAMVQPHSINEKMSLTDPVIN